MIEATVLEHGVLKIYKGFDLHIKRAMEKDFLERIKTLKCGNVTLDIPEGTKAIFYKTAMIESGRPMMKDISETIGYELPDGTKVEHKHEIYQ
jgi:hypothetical protein